MKGRQVRWLGIALLVSASAGEAAAQRQDCAVLRALANADGNDFADLRLGIEAGSGVSVALRGGASRLSPAHDCDLEADSSEVGLSCRWEFSSEAGAAAFFAPLLDDLGRCLGAALDADAIETQTTGWAVTRRHRARFASSSGETEFALSLIEYSAPAGTLPESRRYYVETSSTWSAAEPPEKDDEAD
ncbi:MAG TPA: hypothetical protein VN231_00610 [Allosphingosinicella sp.]|nr:hypothetical protein [Allosphingosinicella sp.]